jgi:hypothetical protein
MVAVLTVLILLQLLVLLIEAAVALQLSVKVFTLLQTVVQEL